LNPQPLINDEPLTLPASAAKVIDQAFLLYWQNSIILMHDEGCQCHHVLSLAPAACFHSGCLFIHLLISHPV
jgi:hypothetical protein